MKKTKRSKVKSRPKHKTDTRLKRGASSPEEMRKLLLSGLQRVRPSVRPSFKLKQKPHRRTRGLRFILLRNFKISRSVLVKPPEVAQVVQLVPPTTIQVTPEALSTQPRAALPEVKLEVPAPPLAEAQPVETAEVQSVKPTEVQTVEPASVQSVESSEVQIVEVEVQVIAPPPPRPSYRSPWEDQFLSTGDLLKPDDPMRQSIEAFLADQRSPHTRRAYQKDLKRFVKFLHLRNHQQGLENLSRTVLIAYKEFLLSESLEHTTIDRHLATLRSFFKWLVDDGILTRSPADGVRFLNPKRISRTNGFSDEEVKKLLTLPNLHTRSGALHYAILMVLFYCGLRRSELCDLRTTSLGTERGERVIRLRGKGNAERVLVMTLPVWNAVKYYFHISRRDLTQDENLFRPIRNNRTGVLEKPLDPSMIFYIVTKYARQAGIVNRVSPHSCRATAISNARDHHVPDRAIQEFAGWASTDMITRYDKRKSSIEDSAAHSISYGATSRVVPDSKDLGAPHSTDLKTSKETGV